MIGAGVNGEAVAETFVARGRRVLLWDVDAGARERGRRPRRRGGRELTEKKHWQPICS